MAKRHTSSHWLRLNFERPRTASAIRSVLASITLAGACACEVVLSLENHELAPALQSGAGRLVDSDERSGAASRALRESDSGGSGNKLGNGGTGGETADSPPAREFSSGARGTPGGDPASGGTSAIGAATSTSSRTTLGGGSDHTGSAGGSGGRSDQGTSGGSLRDDGSATITGGKNDRESIGGSFDDGGSPPIDPGESDRGALRGSPNGGDSVQNTGGENGRGTLGNSSSDGGSAPTIDASADAMANALDSSQADISAALDEDLLDAPDVGSEAADAARDSESDTCLPVTHSNGVGETWTDCTPLRTYTREQALRACATVTSPDNCEVRTDCNLSYAGFVASPADYVWIYSTLGPTAWEAGDVLVFAHQFMPFSPCGSLPIRSETWQ